MSRNRSRNSAQKRALKERIYRKNKRCCFCKNCLSFQSATLEHIISLSKGGGWNIDNLTISCANCNNTRGNIDYLLFKNHQELKKR